METLYDVLVATKNLIETTGWCQGHYSMKNGKPYYDFLSSNEPADSYCLVGAVDKITSNMWKSHGVLTSAAQIPYNRLAWAATHLVVELQKFDGCPADWNDQDENVQRLHVFTDELRAKNTPRDKAKGELNKFKQELKALNLPPIMTKEKVLAAIDCAISSLEC